MKALSLKRAAAVALPLLGLAGCGPYYHRPDLDVPGAYRDINTADGSSVTAPTGGGAQTLADMAWWDLYRDPALQSLIRTALERNYDVRIAAARVEEYRAAGNAGFLAQLPTVSVGASGLRQRVTQKGGPVPLAAGTNPVYNTYALDLDVSYEIDIWGRLRSLTAAARAEYLATEYARDAVRVALVASVASTYFDLLAYDQQLVVTQRAIDTRKRFLDLTQAQFKRGTVSGLDVNRAEANLAAAQATLSDIRRQIAQSENALQILLGNNPAPVARSAPAEGDFFQEPPEVPAGLPSTLVERRPDVRQAEYALVSAYAQLRAQRAALLPAFNITGSLGSQSAALSSFLSGPAAVWSLGLGALLPVIDPERNIFQVKAADARRQQALLQYQQTVQQSFKEVSDALIARRTYRDELQAQQQQVTALRSAEDRVMKRYKAGYSSYFEVIDADQQLLSAELQRIQAYHDTVVSLVQVYKALGGGWPAGGGDAPIGDTPASPPTASAQPALQPSAQPSLQP